MINKLKPGDKVTFDNDRINDFLLETNNVSPEIEKYQGLVLAGIDEVGTVKELGLHLTTVSYADGWELPIPTKYLVLLPTD